MTAVRASTQDRIFPIRESTATIVAEVFQCKNKVMAVVLELPEEVDVDALTERLYLLQHIDEAEKEIAAGKGIPHDEVRRRLAKWLT